MKKLGIISRECLLNDRESRKRNLFRKYFGKDYELNFFPWENVAGDKISEVERKEGECFTNVALSDFELIYITSLGALKGKKTKILSLINKLKQLPGKVINDPDTMKENFNKNYLLMLQEKGIPTVPTKEITGIDYDCLRNLSFNGHLDTIMKPKIFGERMEGVIKTTDINSEEDLENYKKKYGKKILAQPLLEEITKGERSLVFVKDNFSHGCYRHRRSWNSNLSQALIKPISPSNEEIDIAKEVFNVWPTKYHITRFDFIQNQGNPSISEVEMINPALWLARGYKEIDEKFMKIFKEYLGSLLSD